MNTLDGLRNLKPGWDSYKAKPIDERALSTAEELLRTPGTPVPLSDGGIQIEWHLKGGDVEIVILPDGTIYEPIERDWKDW